MAYDKKPEVLIKDSNPAETSFEVVLDATCERLWEKRIIYSLRRINEMDEELKKLEEELDEFISPNHA